VSLAKASVASIAAEAVAPSTEFVFAPSHAGPLRVGAGSQSSREAVDLWAGLIARVIAHPLLRHAQFFSHFGSLLMFAAVAAGLPGGVPDDW
jgi:hypothetical protein